MNHVGFRRDSFVAFVILMIKNRRHKFVLDNVL